MDFYSTKSLHKYISKLVQDGMEDVGNKIEHKVRDKIQDEVYNKPPEPDMYKRTYELKNSLVHSHPSVKGNEIITEIKHDPNLMNSYLPNQHISVLSKGPFIEGLPEAINFGKVGSIFLEGYWTEPRPYMDKAKSEINAEKLCINALKNNLKSAGFEVG